MNPADISFDDLIPGYQPKPVAPKDINFDDLIPKSGKRATNVFDQFDANPFDAFDPPTTSTQDRAQAGAAGVNRGVLSNLPGLPVDTALNVWDLLKAGAGYVGGKTGVLSASQMPALTDRASIPGSSEWLANKERSLGMGKTIDPNMPDDPASRAIFAGGQGVAGSMLGGSASIPNALRNAGVGAASQALPQVAADSGATPTTQVLTSLLPALAPGAARWGANKQSNIELQKAQNAPRDTAINTAQDAGYVFPPSQVNPNGAGIVNSTLERIAGKGSTQQAASIKNQNVTQKLVKQDLGIPDDQPISLDTLNQVRADAGNAYQAVQDSGPIIPMNRKFNTTLDSVFSPYNTSVAQFPKSANNPQINALQQDMQALQAAPVIDPGTLVNKIKQLRSDGFANSGSMDPSAKALGKVQLGSSGALENLIDDHLASTGRSDLLNDYRNARQTIAKTYTAQSAMDPATGNINAVKLAQVLQKGKPLSGNMRTIAQTASVVPYAMKDIKTGSPSISPLDGSISAGSLVAALVSQSLYPLAGALWPYGRTAARGAMLSDPYQRRFVNTPQYSPGLLSKIATRLAPEDLTGLLGAYAMPAHQ